MTDGLYVNPNTFLSFSELSETKSPELYQELYASGGITAAGFDPSSWLGLLPDPDPVLRKTGDGVGVLRSLLGDDKVISSIQNRKLGTLKKKDYLFEAGSEEGKDADATSVALCADLSADLKNIKVYNLFSQLLDAPYYGQTPVEPIWRAEGGKIRLIDLKPRPVEWFGYNADHEPVFSGANMLEAEPVNENKLIIASHFPDATNPYGIRLLSRCLWPVAIKKGGIQFWTMLCERFGMPWVIGKVEGDKGEREKAMTALSSMVQNAVAVVSGSTTVDVHTLSGKGGDLHPALIKYCDRSIARAICGQNLTNEGESTGSYAESQTSSDALDDYRDADEHLLITFMNDLAGVYRNLNSATALAPVFRYREPEDYVVLAELDTKLHGIGVRFKKPHFEKRYRLSEDEFELEGETITGAESGSDFSSAGDDLTPEQEAIETLGDELIKLGGTAMAGNEKKLISAILNSDSYEEAMNRILELYPAMNVNRLADVLEQGMFNAGLFGIHTEMEAANG